MLCAGDPEPGEPGGASGLQGDIDTDINMDIYIYVVCR